MTKPQLTGALLLCLTLLSASCAKTEHVPQIVMPKQNLPQHLLSPVPQPILRGERNADLLEYALLLQEALGQCNANLSAIRSAFLPE